LRQLSTLAEYDQFVSLYLAGEPTADPLSYFVHTGKSANLLTPTGNIVVSGAGSVDANGVYSPRGEFGGKPYYNLIEKPDNIDEWFIRWEDNWIIEGDPAGDGFLYTSTEDVATPDLVTAWGVTNGLAPAPTVTAEMLPPFPNPDNVKTTIFLAPAAGTTTPDLLIDAILEPPTYTVANLCDDTIPPVPHKYHESILVPLVRYNVTMTKYFRQQEGSNLLGQLKEDYARALQLLGLNNPDRKAGSTMPPPPKPEEEQEGAN
jgi:hypothetical protein